MSKLPERIWTASTDGKCHVGFDTPSMNYMNEYARADLAQAPALWTQAQQLAFARAYDSEDAAQRGEPTPWFDGEDAGEWVDERLACVRAGIAALEAPDAGVEAELVEALRGLFGLLDAGSLYEPQAYRAREVLAKLGGKANG